MKKTKKIVIQPMYDTIIYYILAGCFFLILFLPSILSDKKSDLTTTILFYFLFSAAAILCFCIGTVHMQIAEIDTESIIIKDFFHVIAVIKWSDIVSVKKEEIITCYSCGYQLLEWFVIRTNETQAIDKYRLNKRNSFPYLIIVNKKNIEIIREFLPKEDKKN